MMDRFRAVCSDYPFVVAGAVALPLLYVLYKKTLRSPEQSLVECPPNTVLLHQLPRGPYAPSLSPFPLKLETYLRMAKVSYVNDLSGKFSSKSKTPWMTFNGEAVADSQFCIEFLNKKLNIDLNNGLTKEEKAVAKAIQVLVDEHLYWTLVYFRWINDEEMRVLKMALGSMFFIWFIRRMVKKQLHGQGIGRHSTEEIKHIMLTDLQTLTDYLGRKQFMMGPTPSEIDCSVFGMLSQLIWQFEDHVCRNLIKEQFPSLHSYCMRMKATFWPDWDDCITHGGTRKATK